VLEHRESTRLQYALLERAVGWGWARSRVLVIDDDGGEYFRRHRQRHVLRPGSVSRIRATTSRGVRSRGSVTGAMNRWREIMKLAGRRALSGCLL
jgi:hypothetical protein